MVLAGFLLSVLIIYCHTQVSTLGYKISTLEKELALLRVENHDLEGEVQCLASLGRLESLAVGRLGMVKPDCNNILIVELAGKDSPGPGSGPVQDRAGGQSTTGEEKQNRLIGAFAEMVSRLGNKSWLGLGGWSGSTGGTHADNEYHSSKTNNRPFDSGNRSPGGLGFPVGLDSTGARG
ncbi:MAG: Cell division protein FtsL [Firmicutes bacterium ADurb.Bin456]|nr:MAG: Cell division protein FtsL [Firmicutes bacterium ADurb.Bin456]